MTSNSCSATAASTPAEAEAAVDALLEIDCSDAIVGAHASNLRDAISQRISNKAPYIYTPQYEGIACGPSTVAIGSTDAELLGPALHWLGRRKIARSGSSSSATIISGRASRRRL